MIEKAARPSGFFFRRISYFLPEASSWSCLGSAFYSDRGSGHSLKESFIIDPDRLNRLELPL